MNKSHTMLKTCHLVAKSHIIIEVAANALKKVHSPLWIRPNDQPIHRYPALNPDVTNDPNQVAMCPLSLDFSDRCIGLNVRGQERGGVKAGE